jgi:chaperone modulatory protein CbpM
MSRPRPSGMAGADRWVVRYPLARPPRLDLDGFAASAGLHPELVRRLVALGLVQATRDRAGRLWFTRAELATVARVQRLRAGLSLNWAAIGLVLDLLDRIDVLERDLRARPRPPAKE